VAGTLDGAGELALVASASASLAAWADFAFFGYKTAKNIDLFVIDRDIFICAELANLGARNVASPARLLFHIHIHFIGHNLLLPKVEGFFQVSARTTG
jgi:hypothetical protein